MEAHIGRSDWAASNEGHTSARPSIADSEVLNEAERRARQSTLASPLNDDTDCEVR